MENLFISVWLRIELLLKLTTSEVVVTFLIVIILVYVLVIVVFVLVNSFLLVRVVVVAESAHLVISRLPLLAETILCLPHLVMLGATEHCIFVFAIVVEYLLLLSLLLVFLESLNDLILLLPSLLVLQVVHVQFVLEVINVGVLFDVHMIVPL